MEKRSLVLTAKKKLEWQINRLPFLKENEVLVRTIAGAISIGAELPQYDERDLSDLCPKYPKETGYESYGEVIEVGENVSSINVGDRLVAFYGHSDYGIIEANKAILVPKDIHYSYALLTILSCDAAKGVLKLQPSETDKVLVTGMGTMGLLTLYFLKEYLNLKQVDVIEPNQSRGRLAKKFGAHNVYKTDPDMDNYDFGIECAAKNEAFALLQKSIKENGEICILSDGNIDKLILQPEFYEKELKIVGSSDGWDYTKHAKWFFNQLKKTQFVNEIFQLNITQTELIQCFQQLSDCAINPLKVLVTYE